MSDQTKRLLDDESLVHALKALPVVQPPSQAWDSIQTQLSIAGVSRQSSGSFAMSWAAAVVLVCVAASVVYFGIRLQSAATITPIQTTTADARARLIAESTRLERILNSLPEPQSVMRVGTVSTIVGLEDHIALIDYTLADRSSARIDGATEQLLWEERVNMMNVLVTTRMANSSSMQIVY